MDYPKIETLFKRIKHGKKKGKIIQDQLTHPEFGAIKSFDVTEKVDGMNLCLSYQRYNDGQIRQYNVSGRSKDNNTEFKQTQLDFMDKHFGIEVFETVFPGEKNIDVNVFGEFFGGGIRPGDGLYNGKNHSFAVFDVCIDGWWLESNNVEDVARKMNFDIVPYIGTMSIEEIIEYVKSKPGSIIANGTMKMEGIVATSHPMMYYRNRNRPIKFKLKVNDFK